MPSSRICWENKILILRPTGAIGRHIVWACVKAGNPTYALVRKTEGNVNKPKLITAANPDTKEQLLESFKSSGVILLDGDMNDHKSLVKAVNQSFYEVFKQIINIVIEN